MQRMSGVSNFIQPLSISLASLGLAKLAQAEYIIPSLNVKVDYKDTNSEGDEIDVFVDLASYSNLRIDGIGSKKMSSGHNYIRSNAIKLKGYVSINSLQYQFSGIAWLCGEAFPLSDSQVLFGMEYDITFWNWFNEAQRNKASSFFDAFNRPTIGIESESSTAATIDIIS